MRPATSCCGRSRARLHDTLGDRYPVARLGGDAFAVILAGVQIPEALMLAAKVRRAVAQPIELDGRTIELSLSAGIAVAGTGDGPESLVHDAELAMGRAKQNGGDRTEVFAAAMAVDTTRRENVQDQLRHALQHDGVRVHFQPIVDIDDRSRRSAPRRCCGCTTTRACCCPRPSSSRRLSRAG